MFRITEDPSSGSLIQCLVKNYKNVSIVSVKYFIILIISTYYILCISWIIKCLIVKFNVSPLSEVTLIT